MADVQILRFMRMKDLVLLTTGVIAPLGPRGLRDTIWATCAMT